MPAGVTPLLEDAFATASVRGLPPGAVLAVRKLVTGPLTAQLGRSAIKLIAEAKLNEAWQQAVRIDDVGATDANAVWFPSVAAAYMKFAGAIAMGSAHVHWFWPCVCRAIRHTSSVSRDDPGTARQDSNI